MLPAMETLLRPRTLLLAASLALAGCGTTPADTTSQDTELEDTTVPDAAVADTTPDEILASDTDSAPDSGIVPDVASDSGASPDTDAGPGAPLTVVAEAYPGGALLSLWAGATGSVWVAGGDQLSGPLVARLRTDNSWELHDPGTGAQAWWVHGLDGGPIWVVGEAGSIARYDGQVWTDESPDLPGATLYGVWGAAADDVWAVGGPSLTAADGVVLESDVMLHFDGLSWERVDLEGARPGGSLFKVWGSSASDVYAVGSGGMILRFDGEGWATETVLEPTSASLFTVAGRGPEDVWAVGGGGKAVLLHREAAGWVDVALPDLSPQIMQGLWTAPSRPLYVSGAYGFAARLDASGGWTVLDAPTGNPLHAVRGDSTGALWAAGGNILTLSPSYEGTLLVAGREVPELPSEAPPEPDPEPMPDVAPDTTVDASAETNAETSAETSAETMDDGGPTPDVGPSPPCDPPQTSCPVDSKPYPGGSCAEGLACDYEPGDWAIEHFTCEEGFWVYSMECLVPGCSSVPPFGEICEDPFGGQLSDVVLELGSATQGQPFVPFEPGELVPVIWGPQGFPMIAVRFRATGADAVSCATATLSTALAGGEAMMTQNLRLHCGTTLATLLVVPGGGLDCPGEVFDFDLLLEVEGLGSVTTPLTIASGGSPWCPP